ncbi:MAG: phosphate ABC transporter permease subunit PstC [Candidatus Cloacimonetes bacterium]|jgi:phosphate transport system permease protein|nr:phosphate ABC transporter permease subunit PstC [Candidatus Cloacimonadota bacterium]MDD4156325.1 phosphate ABC transporter permease subunit PstC [Candidatus Cloacimonadota bacterium]
MFNDKLFKYSLFFFSILMLLILAIIFFTLLDGSMLAIKNNGFSFLYSSIWNPVMDEYGALPFLSGTLITSFLSLIICIPFALVVAILLGEYYKKGIFSTALNTAIELLAGIPSIIYGFWGLFFFVPIMRQIQMRVNVPPFGVGIITASIILTIMIIPYAASIAREIINMVPSDLKEAAYSLGATRLEIVKNIILPHSFSGIFAGILLALGRALGETMAVTMVIGNANIIPKSFFSPGNTMASLIANEFAEAAQNIHLSSLVQIGLLLFLVTAIINIIGQKVLQKFKY